MTWQPLTPAEYAKLLSHFQRVHAKEPLPAGPEIHANLMANSYPEVARRLLAGQD